ncbi:hypothetical protein [Synechococcus sp. M16CYN]|uniref:hypothetical protein n=1 Tax=Synechococcus sp. M16CYN TaxID=3103139 RepID=UPI003341FFC0
MALIGISLASCTGRVEQATGGSIATSQHDPALSGNGQWLAVISDLQGRQTVQLRNVPNGSIQALPQLRRYQPHSSPSLSWNGRYLALIIQDGRRRIVTIADRLKRNLHTVQLPGERNPVNVSLAPDAQSLALQVTDQGFWRVEIFDLSDLLELDQVAGQTLSTPPFK